MLVPFALADVVALGVAIAIEAVCVAALCYVAVVSVSVVVDLRRRFRGRPKGT